MNKTTIITRKIEIYVNQPDLVLRKEQNEQIKVWLKHSRDYANKTMSFLHSVKFMDKVNEKINDNLTSSFSDYIEGSKRNSAYKIFAHEYKELLPSYIRSSINNDVYNKYQQTFKDVLKGVSSIPSYRQGYPIRFMKSVVRNLTPESFEFFKIPCKFKYGRDKSNNRSIVTKVTEGEYGLSDSSITYDYDKRKMFILLTVKIPVESHHLDEKKIMGVDLGLNNPAYVTISGDEKFRRSIGTRESFIDGRVYIQKQLRILTKSLKFTKGGKGRKKKLQKRDSYRSKERNYVKNQNHIISKEIVRLALLYNCSMINLEDLTGIGKDVKNSFVLRNWSYFELQSMIKNKSKQYGIVVNMVDAKYTSQRCSECGHIHQDNRMTQSEFECVECGFKENADYNASKNISIAHTDEFKKNIKKHKKKIESLKK